MKYTKEQKKKYLSDLRRRWKESKRLADNDKTALALFREGHRGSYYSFYFTLLDMKKFGYSGVPYIDCKTFGGWKESGFKVKKGEKSKIRGIVWMHPISKDSEGNEAENDMYLFPKLYNLFHKTQVEAIL